MKSRIVYATILLTLACLSAAAKPSLYIAKCCNSGSSLAVIPTHSSAPVQAFGVGQVVIAVNFSPDGKTAYLLDVGVVVQGQTPPGRILVLDVTTHQVTATIQLPGSSAYDFALSPDGKHLYAGVGIPSSKPKNYYVEVIDTSTLQLTAAIPIDYGIPAGIAISPDSSTVYVAGYLVELTNTPGCSCIWVIDAATNTRTAYVQLPTREAGPLVISPDGQYLYTTGVNEVYSVYIDAIATATGTVVQIPFALIGPGNPPPPAPLSLAASPDGKRVYVGGLPFIEGAAGNIGVIDTASNKVVAKVTTAAAVERLAVTPDSRAVYGTLYTAPATGSTVDEVVELSASSLEITATYAVANEPVGIAVTPDGHQVYVANALPSQLLIADGASAKVKGSNGLMFDPWAVAVAPAVRFVYVANQNDTVSVVILKTALTVATIPVTAPFDFAVTPDQSTVYVINLNTGVSAIRTATNMVTTTIPVTGAYSLAVSPDGSTLYVTGGKSNTIAVIDTATNLVVDSISVPGGPSLIAITPDGMRAYVTEAGYVDAIDLATKQILATVPAVNYAPRIAITPDGSQAWLGEYNDSQIAVLDTATNTFTTTIPVNGGADAIVFTPDGKTAYVTTSPGTEVAIIDTASLQVTGAIPTGGDTLAIALVP